MDRDVLVSGPSLLTEEEEAELEKIGRVIRPTSGSVLMGEGEGTDFALLIRKGYVKVQVGERGRIIAITGPGEMAGESAILRRRPRNATVIAIQDVEALFIPGEKWLEFLYAHPRALHAVAAMLADRIDATNHKSIESYLGAEQRLAGSLLGLHGKGLTDATGEGAVLHFSQRDLADLAGVSRESVVQVMRAFKAEGIVATGRQRIILKNLDALGSIAGGDLTLLG